MKANQQEQNDILRIHDNIPPHAARQYITDMLGELMNVAKQSGQQDLYILLKLSSQAACNVVAD